MDDISDCVNKQDTNSLLRFLKSKASPFKTIIDDNIDWYMAQLTHEKESKLVTSNISFVFFFVLVTYRTRIELVVRKPRPA